MVTIKELKKILGKEKYVDEWNEAVSKIEKINMEDVKNVKMMTVVDYDRLYDEVYDIEDAAERKIMKSTLRDFEEFKPNNFAKAIMVCGGWKKATKEI